MSSEITVPIQTQTIIVSPPSKSISAVLAGPPGPTGATGATGDTGPAGPTGPAGGIFASRVVLDGSSGCYISTPDSPNVSITGDIDIMVRASLDDWTPSAIHRLVAKQGLGVGGYEFRVNTSGYLEFAYSTTGADNVYQNASSPLGFLDGSTNWVRVTLDVDNGAGSHVLTFYKAPDSVTPPTVWTTVSSHTVAGGNSIFDNTRKLILGSSEDNNYRVSGKIYRAMVYSGIGGALKADFNPARGVVAGTTFEAITGEVWTLNGSAVYSGGDNGSYDLIRPTLEEVLRYSMLPSGAVAQSFDRSIHSATNVSELSTGRLSLYAIALPAGIPINSITFISGSTGAGTPTNQWFGIFDANRNMLRLTSDNTTTAWGTTTARTLNLSSQYITTYSGLYYVGIMVAATTVPNLLGFAGNSTIAGLVPILKGSSSTGLTNPASCPSTAGAIAATANMPYFYLS